MLYPNSFESKIGFDKIREMIKGNCLCNLGKQNVDKIKFSNSHKFIDNLINQVEEFRQIILMEDNFPLNHFFDTTESLKRISVIGTFIQAEELFNLRRSLETIKAILRFFKSKREDDKYPYLQKIVSGVNIHPFILNRIDQILTGEGRIKDNASSELQRIRSEIRSKERGISKQIHQILNSAQKSGYVDTDVSLAIRDGRSVIPIDSSNKRKIKGIVVDESATGKTSYVEPAEIVELNNELKELGYSEGREIVKILTNFSDDIRPYIDDLLHSYKFLGTIDFIRAKAKLALKLDAVKPIVSKEPTLNWKKAIHPLLFLSFKKEKRNVVPLDISLNAENQRILLISGPNAGGKSVCLQTVGLLQYMFQSGLLVSMSENSEMGLFKNLFIDIGDDQSIENDLSTYSSHLYNMKHFVKNADKSTLLLIDEFGTGTEPMLGGSIAEAILDNLNKKKAKGVITTHYTNLKHFASSEDGIENGAMLFDTDKINPLFKLSIGEPGSSFAFEIARKIGLPEEILKHATTKIGKEHINFDKNLKDIIRDKRYWASKRDKIRKEEKKLDKLVNDYEIEIDSANKTKKAIIKKANEDAEELLRGANKKIENTIKGIKENQAEKEKTKLLRQNLEIEKNKLTNNKDKIADEKILEKIEKIKNRKNKTQKPKQENNQTKKKPDIDTPITIGDKVQIKGQASVGEVLEVNGKNLNVAFGNMKTSIKLQKVEKISNTKYNQLNKQTKTNYSQDWDFGEKRISFKPEIDVRGKRAEEALQEVRDFVDKAIVINMGTIKILHGKGSGILRLLIREYLQTVDVVKQVKDEQVQFGGSGITIVEFEN
ncbi:MAG: Smr/MutS family protein [Bacteroidota bacterium]|nr:Smr/MutS family protein [Bacteroidota bacterium]